MPLRCTDVVNPAHLVLQTINYCILHELGLNTFQSLSLLFDLGFLYQLSISYPAVSALLQNNNMFTPLLPQPLHTTNFDRQLLNLSNQLI